MSIIIAQSKRTSLDPIISLKSMFREDQVKMTAVIVACLASGGGEEKKSVVCVSWFEPPKAPQRSVLLKPV